VDEEEPEHAEAGRKQEAEELSLRYLSPVGFSGIGFVFLYFSFYFSPAELM